MKDLSSKVAVVTGAASGIGREIAINLASKDCRLALSDVNSAGLAETVGLLGLKDDQVSTYLVDSSDKDATEQFAKDVITDFGQVDVVINNAGIASMGSIEETPYDVFERVINVNMWGVVNGCKAFLPYLKQREEASLVNIASINSVFPFPKNGPYNMSKYAVYGLNETLMMELKDTSVQVLSVHPGGIQTNIANNAIDIDDSTKKNFNKFLMTTAESAAKQIINGIQSKRSQIFIGPDAKVFQFIKRISPRLALFVSNKLVNSAVTKIGASETLAG